MCPDLGAVVIDGFSHTDLLEDVAQPHPCREIARSLALQGHTVTHLADALGVSPMTAWWLSDGIAVNDCAPVHA